MSNNFEIVIQMLKKSLILIALIFVVAVIPSKAESLQELINRKKIEAIAKVKPMVQKMINDSIEVYKQSKYWKGEYLDIENLEFVFTAALDLNENCYDYNTSVSLYKIIDTTKIIDGSIEVISKDKIHLFAFSDLDLDFHIEYETLHPRMFSRWSTSVDGCVQSSIAHNTYIDYLKLRFSDSNLVFVSIPKIFNLGIKSENRIYVIYDNGDGFDACEELDSYLKHLVANKEEKRLVLKILGRAYEFKYQKALKDTLYESKNALNYSKSIARISKFIDSVNQIYLKPIQDNPNFEIFDKLKVEPNSNCYKDIEKTLKRYGYSMQDFMNDTTNLKFIPRFLFQFSENINKYKSGDDLLEYLDVKLDKGTGEGYDIDIIKNNLRLAQIDTDGWITNCSTLPKEYIYVDSLLPNIIWKIYTPIGYLVNKDNQLYFTNDSRSFKLKYNKDSNVPRLIPYQQYIDQVINGYYIQELFGE